VVTVTSTVPVPAGETAEIVLSLVMVKLIAAIPVPKYTAVAVEKPLPEMVTAVPPDVDPLFGLMALTVGLAITGAV
jgi:hypothetical protein